MQMHQKKTRKKQENKLLPSSEDQSDVERHCESSIGLSKSPATRPTEEKIRHKPKKKQEQLCYLLWTSWVLFSERAHPFFSWPISSARKWPMMSLAMLFSLIGIMLFACFVLAIFLDGIWLEIDLETQLACLEVLIVAYLAFLYESSCCFFVLFDHCHLFCGLFCVCFHVEFSKRSLVSLASSIHYYHSIFGYIVDCTP